MSDTTHHTTPPLRDAFRQPRSVWAIAFATTISFMGVGLVDPILPAISEQLHATPTQAMLLFTSYLAITALAMFFSCWLSARLGVRRTLLTGLLLVVVFAAGCALVNDVSHIIMLRAGWGLGNALFVSTALSAIVGASSGSAAGAIVLYEAALGVGMAFGPLAGGLLGQFSWRGPFFGTASLMAVAFIGIITLLNTKNAPAVAHRPHIWDAFRALNDPALRTLSATALCYNITFFVLLAYSPFPLESAAHARGIELGAFGLGLVFFGWGVALAITSVVIAPILTRRFGLAHTIHAMLAAITVVMIIAGLGFTNFTALTGCVIVGGALFGISNTALTEAVMDGTNLPRAVASSAYSGVRFLGGAISSGLAGVIAKASGPTVPYYVAAIFASLGLIVLVLGHGHLSRLTAPLHLSAQREATAVSAYS